MVSTFLERRGKPSLAYNRLEAGHAGGALPTVVFMGGFRSDKEGTKALFLEQQCRGRGQAFVRFDYTAHGQSGGVFKDCTLSTWLADALAVIDELTAGPVILVGSSMGGWLALLAALARPERVKGLLGLAAAPDFTREYRDRLLNDSQRQALAHDGFIRVSSDYSPEPYIITKALIEDGEQHCLLDRGIDLSIPVIFIQGMKDTDVPWQTAHRIKNAFINGGGNAEVILVEQGDHRLSKPEDLEMIGAAVQRLSQTVRRAGASTNPG